MTESSPWLGVLLHAIGGLCAASFYLPFRQVKTWPWENAWILGGLFSWILAPGAAALVWAPGAWELIAAAPPEALFWTWAFGFLWGIGGLAFGLTMRFLGIALGYAVALGLSAFFGTLVPPVFSGAFGSIATSLSGQVTLAGLGICLVGIAMSGRAGLNKERELDEAAKKASAAEFDFGKGLLVALLAGFMSACMAFSFAAGKPIAALSVEAGVPPLWQNLPVLIVALFGGFCLNLLWCAALIIRRGTFFLYFGKGYGGSGDTARRSAAMNGAWCALAGVTWYLQFFFYGMGTTKMGAYEFSSWTLHMASIIIFSTIWGIALREWKGTSRATHRWIAGGLAVLIASTVVVGLGNYLASN